MTELYQPEAHSEGFDESPRSRFGLVRNDNEPSPPFHHRFQIAFLRFLPHLHRPDRQPERRLDDVHRPRLRQSRHVLA